MLLLAYNTILSRGKNLAKAKKVWEEPGQPQDTIAEGLSEERSKPSIQDKRQ